MRTALLLICACTTTTTATFATERDRIIQAEAQLALGGDLRLSEAEQLVNNCLMFHKYREINYDFEHPQYYNFSRHYFDYKKNIKRSKVYKIIKDMPKGAALHVHDMGILSPDYLMALTYMHHLYVCFGKQLQLRFSNNKPTSACEGEWQLMSDARHAADNIMEFDENLRRNFTLVVSDPEKVYPTIKETWGTFMKYFETVDPLLSYRPIWEQYFYDALKLFREHNVMYVEVRSVLPSLYELDGTVFDPLVTAKAYKKSITRFMKDYPDFFGAKLIYAPPRMVNATTVQSYLRLAGRIKEDMPELFAGFDLVGQEDLGEPLIEFAPQLEAASDKFNYFFHAGETDWYGTTTDANLIDAILLGAKRLGHAYALSKHPVLMDEVIQRDIGLEVNVISNTVLSLVKDVRNHPLSGFLARGLPVVLSSDDPGIWEADPISEDFYIAFVGAASKSADLKMLKKLAMNSLKYSAFNATEKDKAIRMFKTKWDKFIKEFSCANY